MLNQPYGYPDSRAFDMMYNPGLMAQGIIRTPDITRQAETARAVQDQLNSRPEPLNITESNDSFIERITRRIRRR